MSSSQTQTDYRLFVLDTGTTGTNLDKDRVHSLSICDFELGLLFTSPVYVPPSSSSSTVYPPSIASSSSAWAFRRVWASAVDFVRKQCGPGVTPLMLAHNAPFDAAFLHRQVSSFSECSWLWACTMQLFSGSAQANKSMLALARSFGVNVDEGRFHHSAYDVKVLLRTLKRIEKQGAHIMQRAVAVAVPMRDMAARYGRSVSFNERALVGAAKAEGVEVDTPIFERKDRVLSRRLRERLQNQRQVEEEDEEEEETDVEEEEDEEEEDEDEEEEDEEQVEEVREQTQHVFVTRTGKYYHATDTCYFLRNANSITRVPFEHDLTSPSSSSLTLSPCYRCSFDHLHTRNSSSPSPPPPSYSPPPPPSPPPASAFRSSSPTTPSRSDNSCVYITRTGKFYHATETCDFLRKASSVSRVQFHNDLTSPTSGSPLSPCYRCSFDYLDTHHSSSPAPPPPSPPPASAFRSVSPTTPSRSNNAYVYITRTGKFYHATETCDFLSRASSVTRVQFQNDLTSPSSSRPLAPCYRCSFDYLESHHSSPTPTSAHVEATSFEPTTPASPVYDHDPHRTFGHPSNREYERGHEQERGAPASPVIRVPFSFSAADDAVVTSPTTPSTISFPHNDEGDDDEAGDHTYHDHQNEENEGKFVVTQYGKYFHSTASCRYLSRSRYVSVVHTPSPSLSQCPLCFSGEQLHPLPHHDDDDESDTASLVRVPVPSPSQDHEEPEAEGPFVRTRTGAKFHALHCPVIRGRDGTRPYELHRGSPSALDPCRRCLPNLYNSWYLE